MELIDSYGQSIAIQEKNGVKVGMPLSSLTSHIQKHPDIAKTPEEYLNEAIQILQNGRTYKNGKLYKGKFLRYYDSEEINCTIINTVYQRFN